MCAEYFPGMLSRISGIGTNGIQKKLEAVHAAAYHGASNVLPIGGFYKQRRSGEKHAWEAQTMHMLQTACDRGSYEIWKQFSAAMQANPPIHLRDLLAIKPMGKSIPIEEVESITAIRKRFVTPGMSLGALSPEAHKLLNVAMNRIGAKSDSGEGGEDPAHFVPEANGDNPSAKIKQVASGRFGVTAEYLNHCEELEIKVAQGAKPGEGGQLPGMKVTSLIARLRHSTPGVTLISPPPHHDIYSIEDLAQLIYDLKQINPRAKVTVKLVASSGVGTIAAGVAKAKADVILISGHNGGTGASPATSIKYAGLPWEMGLTEAHQVLSMNKLRERVTLRTDGGLRTGRDIVMAAMMGAEEYGIGTAALISMGCIMVRQCQSNTCPVGVCTQNPELRAKFTGTADKVVNLITFYAQEVREILAEIGARSLDDVIGRADLLTQVSRGLGASGRSGPQPAAHHRRWGGSHPLRPHQAAQPGARHAGRADRGGCGAVPERWREDAAAVRGAEHTSLGRHADFVPCRQQVRDAQFAAARSSDGQAAGLRRAIAGRVPDPGLKLEVAGDANDYVGKGLSGGTIVVRPAMASPLVADRNTIIGNTVLYGATDGFLFAAGRAGERFAVRNSGASVVVEGCGSNGCEYMTGGVAVILGSIGANFGAGMTGGMAYLYDPDGASNVLMNMETLVTCPVTVPHWEAQLRGLVERHAAETGSKKAQRILSDWERERAAFLQICPKEMLIHLPAPLTEDAGAIPAE